jgi:hypothetical protein
MVRREYERYVKKGSSTKNNKTSLVKYIVYKNQQQNKNKITTIINARACKSLYKNKLKNIFNKKKR